MRHPISKGLRVYNVFFTMPLQKWEALKREIVFQKYKRVIERVDFKLPDGRVEDYYLQVWFSPICVLPITKRNTVVLVKQYRPGPDEILCEIPGGGMDANETPEQAAQRELLEETGYAGKLQLVTRSILDAYSAGERYCFVATQCEKVAEPKPDANEFLEPVELSLDEFRKLLRSGRLTDVEVGYLGLDYLGLLK